MSHEQIWAPWRLGYILAGKEPAPTASAQKLLPGAEADCFLCQCAVEGDDRTRLIVARGMCSFVVMNRYPYNNGHLLISPRRHVAKLTDLTAEEHSELTRSLTEMVSLLERVMRPDGFNVGLNLGRAAGAGVPGHLHWHIVPRWSGDTNFMPALAGIRVIPQSLEALWDLLQAEIAKG